MKLPRAILFDLDDTILSAFGQAEGQWLRVVDVFAAEFAPVHELDRRLHSGNNLRNDSAALGEVLAYLQPFFVENQHVVKLRRPVGLKRPAEDHAEGLPIVVRDGLEGAPAFP